jgi:threonine dehydrogenase-like Zn-dependent dehydrogenase
MSSYKATIQGEDHKRVPKNIKTNPVIIGHEICGDLVEIGAKWKDQFKAGQKFSIQPALNYQGSLDAPGYSFEFIGGDATYVIIPELVMQQGCLLTYEGEAYFAGSLAEPVCCVIGGFHCQFHIPQGTYTHNMGIVEGGCMAMLAGAGPMGMASIDFAIHGPRRPGLLVVTDISSERLERCAGFYPEAEAAKNGVKLIYVNTSGIADVEAHLRSLTPNSRGYDDVFVNVPFPQLIEQGDNILAQDGCLNLFAGPTDNKFKAPFNFYNAHYLSTHIASNSGGNVDDLREALDVIAKGKASPETMVTHIGGLDCVVETTKMLPKIPGGKKLVYTGVSMPLTAIDDFAEKGKTDPFFAKLAEIVGRNRGLWSLEAEKYLLANAKKI